MSVWRNLFLEIAEHHPEFEEMDVFELDQALSDCQAFDETAQFKQTLIAIGRKTTFDISTIKVKREELEEFVKNLNYPLIGRDRKLGCMVLLLKDKKKRYHLTYFTGDEKTVKTFDLKELVERFEDIFVEGSEEEEFIICLPNQKVFSSKDGEDFKGKPLKRFFRLLSYDKKDIGLLYLNAIFAGIISLTLPLGIQAIIGIITVQQIATSWIVLIFIITLGLLVGGGLQIMQMWISELIQQRIFARASFEFAFRIPRLKLENILNSYAPELINRFFDTLTLQKGLSKILIDLTSSLLQVLFGLILLSTYHPFFIAFSILLVFILALIIRLTGPAGLKTSLKESKYKYEVAYWLEEMGRTLETFKLAGYTNLPYRKTDVLVSNYLDARRSHFRILIFQFTNVLLFKVLVTAGLLVIGTFLVIDNQISIGQFVASEIIIILLIGAVEKIILSMESVYDVLTALEKIGAVTDLPLESEAGVDFTKVQDHPHGIALRAQNLTYKFPDSKTPIIKDIEFDVKPGQRLCISGYNGSGRSTLINIISGLFQNYEGSLLFNGIPAKNINISSLRYRIGDTLSQEDIFSGTLEENISMGLDGVSLKDVVWASERADLMPFVQQLPEGFNTVLQPQDRRVSQTILPRIILARGLVKRPPLLVVDDHLLNFGPIEKQLLTDRLVDENTPWTLIIVSNDPIVASKADQVIVMKEGKVIDNGKFDELVGKPYAEEVFQVKKRN